MAKQRHLWNRKGRFYFRISIPHKLVSKFGCKELSCSLRTTDKYKAQYRALTLQRGIQLIFMQLDHGVQLTPEQVKQITKTYFDQALARLEKQMDSAHRHAKMMNAVKQAALVNATEDNRQEIEAVDVSTHQDRLDYLVPADYDFPKDDSGQRTGAHYQPFFFDGNPDSVLRYVLDENDLNALESYTPSYKALQKGVHRAITELRHQHQQRMDFETDIQIEDEWFTDHKPVQMVQGQVVSPHKISECFEQFMREEHSQSPQKTGNQRRKSYNLWIELFGDGSISAITRDNVRAYREMLKRYPKHRNIHHKDLSLADIKKLNLTPDQYIAPPTINATSI